MREGKNSCWKVAQAWCQHSTLFIFYLSLFFLLGAERKVETSELFFLLTALLPPLPNCCVCYCCWTCGLCTTLGCWKSALGRVREREEILLLLLLLSQFFAFVCFWRVERAVREGEDLSTPGTKQFLGCVAPF
jgi:hypothetical protein